MSNNNTQKRITATDGSDFALSFKSGLPSSGEGPSLFLMRDGSVHCGDLVWVRDALNPSGQSHVLRTTNPVGGLHTVLDVPASHIIGYAFAGAQWPFAKELASAY
jgi:hypothetical protein